MKTSTHHSKSEEHVETHYGTAQEFIKQKNSTKDEVLGKVGNILKNYDGGMICVIVDESNEDGEVTGTEVFIGGNATPLGTMNFAAAMAKAADSFTKTAQEHAPSPEDLLGQLLEHLNHSHSK